MYCQHPVFFTAFDLRGVDLPFFSCREKHFMKKKTFLGKKLQKSSIIEVFMDSRCIFRHLEYGNFGAFRKTTNFRLKKNF
jgi:hypothetical protein